MQYLDPLLVFITHHPALSYGAIFLISLCESLAIVGLLLPGTVIMFGIGAIVSTGSMKLTPVMLMAIAGAIAGDSLSYWLGRHYKEGLREIWPFFRYPGMLKNGEAFFHRHGGKSVLFGRFVGPVRPVIPVVAGMLGMRPVHFGIVNVLSAIGWAFVYILPGVFLGTSLAVAGAVSTRLAVLAAILIAGIWGFIWLSRKLLSLFVRQGPVWFSALQQWSATDRPGRAWMMPLKRLGALLFLSRQGEELLLGFLVLTLLGAGWGFLGVLQDVLAKDPVTIADQAVYHFFQSLRAHWADIVFVAITELGDSFVNIFMSGTILIVLAVKRCYRTAGFWGLTVIGGFLSVELLRRAIHLPRPVAFCHGALASGFPSGHTTMNVILYGFLAILLARGVAGVWRWGLFSSVLVISFVIGISRLYLGAQWLSDVLGGFLIGTSWTALLGIACLNGPAETVPRRLLGLAVVLVLLIAGGWHVARRHETDLASYAPRHKVQYMPRATWQADGWRALAARRIDMAGEPEQPLTVQWAGSLDELSRFLIDRGWQRPPPLSLKSVLGLFSPDTPVEDLPALPRLHDGRAERLRLVRTDGVNRFVVRLWSTDYIISGNDAFLFIGAVEEQGRRQLAGLIAMARDTGEYGRSLDMLQQTLAEGFAVRRLRRPDAEHRAGREHRRFPWRGDVLLAESGLDP